MPKPSTPRARTVALAVVLALAAAAAAGPAAAAPRRAAAPASAVALPADVAILCGAPPSRFLLASIWSDVAAAEARGRLMAAFLAGYDPTVSPWVFGTTGAFVPAALI